MKRGFTLVELLAVIIIIGILFAIIFPLVTNNIKDSEERAYNLVINNIITATKDMIVSESIVIPNDNESITIYIGELKRKGLLPIELVNPMTKKNISNTSTVVVTRTGNSYTYDVNIVDLEENSTENEDAPSIRLNGSYIEYVEINTPYVEKGVTAYSKDGEELTVSSPQIKLNDKEVGSVDTSSLNTYKLIYTVTDKGITTTSIRTVVVRDTTPPVISVPDESTITISQVNGYDVNSGVYAVDNSNESITVKSESSLSNIPGKYIVLYTASDSSGNETSLKRIISVVDSISLQLKENGNLIEEIDTTQLNEKIIDVKDVSNIICNNDVKIELQNNKIRLTDIKGKKSFCNFSNSIIDSVSSLDDTNNNIVLLKDETPTSTIEIPENRSVTIDLNGKTVTAASGIETLLINNGKLTINDKTNNGTMKSIITVLMNYSELVVNGGRYIRENSSSATGGVIDNHDNVIVNGGYFYTDKTYTFYNRDPVTNKNSIFNINGGTIISRDRREFVNMHNKGIFNIKNIQVDNTTSQERVIDNYAGGEFNISNVNISSIATDTVYNAGSGTINIKNSTISTTNEILINNSENGTINIDGGKYTSSGSVIVNYSSKDINIIDKSDRVYIYTDGIVGENHFSIKGVVNLSTGSIYINGNTASNCSATEENKDGICIYNANGRAILNENGSKGAIYIDGAYVVSKSEVGWTGALNLYTGNMYVCNATLDGRDYDISKSGTSEGYIRYTNKVILKGKGVSTDSNNQPYVILDNTISCQA